MRSSACGLTPHRSVEAELVFAGHGLSIPEANHDDFAGLDVQGKLVVYLAGAPPSIAGPLAAHMQSAAERATVLKRHGAIGAVKLLNPKNMDIPWERMSLARFQPAMILADPAMDDSRGLKLAVTVNPEHADKLFAGSGHTFQEILDPADAGKPLPRFRHPDEARGDGQRETSRRGSQNVVACCRATIHGSRMNMSSSRPTSITWVSASRSTVIRSTMGRWIMPPASRPSSTSRPC